MRKFYVLGNPINYSKSPNLFKYIFKKLKIDAHYTAFHISTKKDLENFIKNYNFDGLNITAPYKKIVVDYLDYKDKSVIYTNNSNCIIKQNQHLAGYNTDIFGFEMLLKKNNIQMDSDIIILGSGATAFTVATYLNNINFTHNIYLHSTNSETVNQLIKTYSNMKINKFINQINSINYIVINCAPIRNILNHKEYSKIINNKNCDLVIDINYDFNFSNNIHSYINGNDMFIYQALQSFYIWFGKDISKLVNYDEIKKLLYKR